MTFKIGSRKPQTDAEIKQYFDYWNDLLPANTDFVSRAIPLAQFAHESAWSTSELARNAHNHAGHKFKGDDGWDKTRQYVKDAEEHDDKGNVFTVPDTGWRKYANDKEFAEHHAKWLSRTPSYVKTYAKALNANTWQEQLKALQGTYATDTEYSNKVKRYIDTYNLTQYDTQKGNDKVSTFTPTIIDRRQYAMGGQAWNRNKSAISVIAWHYTAVKRSLNRKIWDHEQYWKNTHGWDRGGYHYYIDSDGVIYHNYNYERITWGVAYNNDYTVHISVEANSASDYSEAQKKAREWLTRKIMADLGIKSNKVLMHKEVYNNSNCCGYTTAQMNEFRAILSKAQVTAPVLDDRFVELPTYRTPVNPFRELKEGDKITIREGFQAWHNPADDPKVQGDEAIKASRDFVGRTGTIKKVKAVSVGYSKRAYLIVDEDNPKDPLNSWIHEHDVLEARSHWTEVEEDAPEQAIPESDDPTVNDDLEPAPDNDFRENYIYFEGKKYHIGDEITE